MTITELAEKHNLLVEYVRRHEEINQDDFATMRDDIDLLLMRLTVLEARVVELESMPPLATSSSRHRGDAVNVGECALFTQKSQPDR